MHTLMLISLPLFVLLSLCSEFSGPPNAKKDAQRAQKNREAIIGTEGTQAVAGKFGLFTAIVTRSEKLVQRHESAPALAKIPVREKKKSHSSTAHQTVKRVRAPVNTVPLSELVNTVCKWAPDADANCLVKLWWRMFE